MYRIVWEQSKFQKTHLKRKLINYTYLCSMLYPCVFLRQLILVLLKNRFGADVHVCCSASAMRENRIGQKLT